MAWSPKVFSFMSSVVSTLAAAQHDPHLTLPQHTPTPPQHRHPAPRAATNRKKPRSSPHGQSLGASPQEPLGSMRGKPWEFSGLLPHHSASLASILPWFQVLIRWSAAGPRGASAPLLRDLQAVAFPCLLWLEKRLGWGTPSPGHVGLRAQHCQGSECAHRWGP